MRRDTIELSMRKVSLHLYGGQTWKMLERVLFVSAAESGTGRVKNNLG
jgi:hypothetical protein